MINKISELITSQFGNIYIINKVSWEDKLLLFEKVAGNPWAIYFITILLRDATLTLYHDYESYKTGDPHPKTDQCFIDLCNPHSLEDMLDFIKRSSKSQRDPLEDAVNQLLFVYKNDIKETGGIGYGYEA